MVAHNRNSYRKALRDLQAGGFSPAQIMGLMKVFENYIEPMSARLDTMIDILRSIDQKAGPDSAVAAPISPKKRVKKASAAQGSRKSVAKATKPQA